MHFSLLFQMYIDEWERCFEWNVPSQYASMIIGLKQDNPSIFKYVMCKSWVWDHETMLVGSHGKGMIVDVNSLTSKDEKPTKPLCFSEKILAYTCYGWNHSFGPRFFTGQKMDKKWTFKEEQVSWLNMLFQQLRFLHFRGFGHLVEDSTSCRCQKKRGDLIDVRLQKVGELSWFRTSKNE